MSLEWWTDAAPPAVRGWFDDHGIAGVLTTRGGWAGVLGAPWLDDPPAGVDGHLVAGLLSAAVHRPVYLVEDDVAAFVAGAGSLFPIDVDDLPEALDAAMYPAGSWGLVAFSPPVEPFLLKAMATGAVSRLRTRTVDGTQWVARVAGPPLALGAAAPGRSRLVLEALSDDDLLEIRVARGGQHTTLRWGALPVLVGGAQDGPASRHVLAQLAEQCSPGSAAEVGRVLGRPPTDPDGLDRLLAGAGAGRRTAETALGLIGHPPPALDGTHPDDAVVEPDTSFRALLGSELRTARLPRWFEWVCVALIPLLVGLLVVRVPELLRGEGDVFSVLQVVGPLVSLPVSVVCARNLWRDRREARSGRGPA